MFFFYSLIVIHVQYTSLELELWDIREEISSSPSSTRPLLSPLSVFVLVTNLLKKWSIIEIWYRNSEEGKTWNFDMRKNLKFLFM